MKAQLLDQSTAVRTKAFDDLIVGLGEFPVEFDTVRHYSTNIKEWLKPVVDLEDFHVYPMNGITEGLNWWTGQESRGICSFPGEYQWVKSTGSEVCYISVPSSRDGNFTDYPDYLPVALDLAYVGSTQVRQIPIHDNVERVFYSLSKPFGVRNIRTGWYFTRQPDPRLEDLIYSAKYYNYYAHWVAETIISKYDIEYVWNRLKQEQKRVCSLLGLVPSDSVWLATTTDPEYQKFRRHQDIARICLSGVYNYGIEEV